MKNSFVEPLSGPRLVFDAEEVRPYGKSILMPIINPEYLFTIETKPQVIIQIDEFPAICKNLNCDYTYVEPPAKVTSLTVDDDGITVIITGEALPLELVSVELGNVQCLVDQEFLPSTEIEIQCSLQGELPAGSWLPQIEDAKGLIFVDSAVEAHVIELTVTSISPKTGLNAAGGNLITISGDNFPSSDDSRYNLSIMLGSARCVPQSIQRWEIVCELEPLVTARRRL